MINVHLGKIVDGLSSLQTVFTCSTGGVLSAADINGDVIDRQGIKTFHLGKNEVYGAVAVALTAFSPGSTQVNRLITAKARLQHGDSSGGGDMADLVQARTTDASARWSYGTSAHTTDFANWTTGALGGIASPPANYELSGFAKRYIRAVGNLTVPGNTTSTASGSTDLWQVRLPMVFMEPYSSPPAGRVGSTSTST